MHRPGLLSITFRQLPVEQIVALAHECALEGIEWGGDIHVPPGDRAAARRAGELTRQAGLQVVAYGSYYRAGDTAADGPTFDAVLDSARELGAPLVRVWAGRHGSADAPAGYLQRVADDTRRIAGLAAACNVAIAFEYHTGTLTDTPASATQLLQAVSHPQVGCLWQPSPARSIDENTAALRALGSHLCYLHVFHWSGSKQRLALAEGRAHWQAYLAQAAQQRPDLWAMLEFVRDDSPAALREDAATLHALLGRG